MKFVTFNIQYGLGRDGRYDLDRTARGVEGADVVALQEVERFWKRSGNLDQVAELLADLDIGLAHFCTTQSRRLALRFLERGKDGSPTVGARVWQCV